MKSKRLLLLLLLALVAPWAANAQKALPYSYGFENNDLDAEGWTVQKTSSYTGISTQAAYSGSYGFLFNYTEQNAYLVSPVLTGTENGVTVGFYYKEAADYYGDEQFYFGYTTDETVTDPSSFTYGSLTTASLEWQLYEETLPAGTKKIAIKYVYNDALYLYLDDFSFEAPSSCTKPVSLAGTANGQEATLTWTGDASSFDVAYSLDATANPDDNIVANVSTTSYTMDGLELDKDHYFWVRSNCGSEMSAWVGPRSIHIGYCVPAPTSVDGNGISNVTFGMGDYLVNNDTPKATYADFSSMIGAAQVGVESTIAITLETGYTYNTYVWVDFDNSLSFDADEVICYGESSSANPTTLTLSFVVPSTQALGDFRMRIGSADSGLGSDPETANPCYTGAYGCFQDYTLRLLEAPSCLTPTNLVVNYTGGTSATLTWNENGTATSWDIQYSTDPEFNDIMTGQADGEPTYTLTGLDLATTYYVRVSAWCEEVGAPSMFSNPVNFTTDMCMPEDMCELTFELTDSWGDGWNGAYISVVDAVTGVELAQMTADNHGGGNVTSTDTKTLNVCDGLAINFVWVSGLYDSETSYVVKDVNGETIFSGAAGNGMITNYTVDCTITNCKTPTNLAVSEVGPHSAVLSWTENGEATAWVVEVIDMDGGQITNWDANTNPFTIPGLAAETNYKVRVRPVCSDFDNKWSESLTFPTDVACPKPTNLSVTAYPTSADVTWEGYADAYDLEWALLPASGSKDPYNDGNWYYYDNGTYVGSVGLGGGEFHWGVMFPAGTYEGTLVSKVKAYDINAMVGTLAIYNDGETAPANQISIQDVEFTGAGDWVEFETYANIDPSKNVWIVFDAVDGAAYPIGTSNDDNGDANGRWVEINGTWYDMANVGVTGRANMLRAYIEEGVDPSTLEWNPVSGITSPYTIEDLQPETTYIVRVKAVCGGDDGESAWTTVTFTTPSACDMPSTFSAEVEATSATLSWVGYQESYNLRYRRTPYAATTYFSEDFDEGLPATWTTIDNDTTTVGNWIALSEINNVYTYYTSPLTGWAHSGDDAVASASFVNGVGAVATDNYLVTPQVTFNGKLRFYATSEYSDPDTYEVLLSTTGNSISDFNVTLQAMGPATYGAWDEVIIDLSDYAGQQGYIAIHHVATDKYWLVIDDFGMYDFVNEDWTNVTSTENTYTATGLIPETEYEWQVQGVNASCEGGLTEWTEISTFTTLEEPTSFTQTLELTEGWNWISSYIEMDDPVDLLLMLEEGLNGNGTVIKNADYTTSYEDEEWFGDLDDEGIMNEQMYKVYVIADCEVELQGMPADPANHTITIVHGWNWIGFPCSETVSIEDALADFEAEEGDILKTSESTTNFEDGEWFGDIEEMVPGQGYMYYSNSEEEKELTFLTGAKAQRAYLNFGTPTQQPNKDQKFENKEDDKEKLAELAKQQEKLAEKINNSMQISKFEIEELK